MENSIPSCSCSSLCIPWSRAPHKSHSKGAKRLHKARHAEGPKPCAVRVQTGRESANPPKLCGQIQAGRRLSTRPRSPCPQTICSVVREARSIRDSGAWQCTSEIRRSFCSSRKSDLSTKKGSSILHDPNFQTCKTRTHLSHT